MIRRQLNPDQAVRHANEFVELGKKEIALDVLFEALKSKHGKNWNSGVDILMTNFLNLCLVLRNYMSVKEGLFQYRLICQNTNIISFESTIIKFIDACSEATSKARAHSREKVLVEDLDATETPETIILKSISETTRQDRSDRLYLTPTLRFMWETFRHILEICRNNKNMEKLYFEVIKKTFSFLQEYERKTEFRKLCEITRTHLQQISKQTASPYSINLSESSSFDTQVEIRLRQLETSMVLELWIEAFKTMEDIHSLLRNYRKTPHPKILAIFYQKISLVFAKASAPLFHAVSLQKLFVLIQEYKKGFKPEEIERISTRALAATISVPVTDHPCDLDVLLFRYSEKVSYMLQLSSILGLTTVPSRSKLIEDISKHSILQYSNPAMVRIFKAFTNFGSEPSICELVERELKAIPDYLVDDLSSYFAPIKRIAFSILLKRFSRFYQSLSIDKLTQCSFYYTKAEVMDILLECARQKFLLFKIDGFSETIHFENLIYDQNGLYNCNELSSGFALFENPLCFLLLKSMDCYKILNKKIEEEKLKAIISGYAKNHENFTNIDEFNRFNKLQDDIQVFRDKLSQENEDYQKQYKAKIDEERARIAELEEKRLHEERSQREKERLFREQKEKHVQRARQQVNELVHSEITKKIFKDYPVDQLKKNPTKFISVHNELREKEILGHVNKMKHVENFIEVLIFSIRKNEQKNLTRWVENEKKLREERWKSSHSDYLQKFERSMKIKAENVTRIVKTRSDLKNFIDLTRNEADKSYDAAILDYNNLFTQERNRLLKERKIERIKLRKEEFANKKQEEYMKQSLPKKPEENTLISNESSKSNENAKPAPSIYVPKTNLKFDLFGDTSTKTQAFQKKKENDFFSRKK